MRRLPLAALICALAVVVGLAACGGDDDGGGDTATQPATTETTTTETGGGGGGQRIEVQADPGGALEFVQDSLTAEPGRATFEFENSSSTPHDFVLEDDGQELTKTPVITDDTATTSATLEAKEYTYFCSVPGHRQAGMEGTLTVE